MNIPFELIFVILFFVLPALGNLQKRLRERGQQEQGDAERPADPERRSAVPSAPTQASTSQQPAPTSSTPSGELGGWLEEAQRRVREAREAEAQGRRRGQAGGQTGRPARPTVATPRPTAQQTSQPASRGPASRPRLPQPRAGQPRSAPPRTPERSLEGRSLEGGSLENYRPERTAAGSTNPDNVSLGTAPPLRVQRLREGGRATMGQRVRLDEESVMNGFIWHQVLSPPLSKRRRTRLSRRQP